ncbi:MAG: PAS domain S-box protein, partial [Gemmatimonadales bacterium]
MSTAPPSASPPPDSDASASDAGPEDSGDFFVAGVGASAGGLEALGSFFEGMSPDCGIAFVVIQHLSPDHRSYMVELLSRKTRLPVCRADDGMAVEPGTIYLIPPRSNLKIHRGRLLLVPPEPGPRAVNLPIDVFFRSLAQDQGARSMGIVLSGTGSDGTMGIRAIKEAGGLVVVQSEDSAQFDGMPRSAISTGLADLVVSLEEMSGHLHRFVRHPLVARQDFLAGEDKSGVLMQKLFLRLKEHTGVDFSYYKASTIDRRIARRISVNQLDTLAAYELHTRTHPDELDHLFNELLIGVTSFLRDPEAWEALSREGIPTLLEERPGQEERPLRVWATACSSGEEAYSLAILLREALRERGQRRDVRIFATDISERYIQAAGRGVYSESEVAGVPSELLERYFQPVQDGYRVNRNVREMVTFAQHNLLKDPPFTRMDLVSCRNALIYFSAPLQSRVLGMFHHALRTGGILFLGSSESLGDQRNRFEALSPKHRVFRARAGSGLEGGFVPPIEATRRDLSDVPGMTTAAARRPLVDRSRALHRLEQVYREIIADYAPACIVVDEQNRVVHLFGRASEYLRFREGRVSSDLFRLTEQGLAPSLRTALHRVERDGGEFTLESIRLEDENGPRRLRTRVREMEGDTTEHGLLRLVFIEEMEESTFDTRVEDPPAGPREEWAPDEHDQALRTRLTESESELAFTKESLQATVEELEAANEELMATNEELQAANEELQSVNEELQTVNAEAEYRIEELNELSNDLNNLFATSSVGTLLLDDQLRIRRLSASLGRLIPLTERHEGLPVEVLARYLHFPELPSLARSAARQDAPSEVEAVQPHNRIFLLRLTPYRTETGFVRGLVLTVIDITSRRKAQERERRQAELVRGVLDAMPSHVAILDRSGKILHVNRPWVEFGQENPPEGVEPDPAFRSRLGTGANYFQVCEEATGPFAEEARTCLAGFRSVLEGTRERFTLEYPCHAPHEQRWFVLVATPLPDRRGLVVSHFDITERREAEQALGRLLVLLARPDAAALALDAEGHVVSWNPAAREQLGWEEDDILGQSWTRLFPDDDPEPAERS